MSATDKKIICRKCGGGHFTLKCNISTENKIQDNNANNNLVDNIKEIVKNVEKPKSKFNNNKTDNYNNRNDNYNNKSYCVKLNNLPTNMTEEEMVELTCDWGNITKIRVNNYTEVSTAYIEFKYEDQADYFVKALDRTDFESIIITAERC